MERSDRLNTRHPWLNEVIVMAHDAGRAIMDVYARDFAVQHKTDNSPLTEADQAAHRLIVARLHALTPDIPVLSEEEIDIPGRERWGKDRYWLVDPLDGTKEFINRNGEFTVNIALIEQGWPILGVVHAPAIGLSYAAAAGEGAFKQINQNAWQVIRCKKRTIAAPWRVVGSRSHAGDSLQAMLNQMGAYKLVPMGSSLKLCLVAEDAADLYPRLGPTSLWDTAAAQCVVQEAGGQVVTLAGTPLKYGNTAELLNPFFIVHGISDMNWPAVFGSANNNAADRMHDAVA